MSLKCRLLRNLAEADEYLKCVSLHFSKRKKKKNCKKHLPCELQDLIKCICDDKHNRCDKEL